MTDAIADPFSSYRPDPMPLPTPTLTPEPAEFQQPDSEYGDTPGFDHSPVWPTPTPMPETFDDLQVLAEPALLPVPSPLPTPIATAPTVFQIDDAMPAALASHAVYGTSVPEGYEADPEFTLAHPLSGFEARLYRPIDGGRPILAFAGTDDLNDVATDVFQAVGVLPQQYDLALGLATRARAHYGDDLLLTGHSLGGGLATYAGMHTGTETMTFNSAGLSWRARLGIWWEGKSDNADRVTHVRIANEILSSDTILPVPGAPGLLGSKVDVPPANPEPAIGQLPLPLQWQLVARLPRRIDNHRMEQVLASLERARANDTELHVRGR
ncbi:MAG: hypothetical protein IPK26_02040 [Planctomycetes bacterium]|nr:hypothetical protein [Planctomycetota bacterium]